MPKIEKSIIENFLESLISEKGLSKNTIESYKSDINQFLERQTTSKSSELIFSRKSIEIYISKSMFEIQYFDKILYKNTYKS